MEWSDEQYVRLYTRDTTNWRRMGWDGQNVCMHLLRKVDRAGALELSGLKPWEAVALAINGPEDAVKRGVEKLLELGTLKVVGDLLVFPNHIEAQTAIKSDRLRQKEARQRRAAGTEQTVTFRDVESRRVTAPSREPEPRHAESRGVTPRHSLLNSALLNSAVRTSDARAPEGPEPDRQSALASLVRREFASRYHVANPSAGLWGRAGDPAVDQVAAWLGSLAGDPAVNLARTLDNFFADAWCRAQHFPITDLAKRAAKYFDPRPFTPPAKARASSDERMAELRAVLNELEPELQQARVSGDADELLRVETEMAGVRAEMRELKAGAA